jgi:hypothetical protein
LRAFQVDLRAAVVKAGFVTIPAGVGPVRARVTPDAMVPLTGDVFARAKLLGEPVLEF